MGLTLHYKEAVLLVNALLLEPSVSTVPSMDAAAARKGWEDRTARPVSLATGILDKMAANVRLSVHHMH